jgi:Arc/MetJ family transcription regulator
MSVYRGSMSRMVRTNVVVDEELLDEVMERYGLRTKRDAIEFALRALTRSGDPSALIQRLEGGGWEGELDSLRDW